jgi:hypothetical protein
MRTWLAVDLAGGANSQQVKILVQSGNLTRPPEVESMRSMEGDPESVERGEQAGVGGEPNVEVGPTGGSESIKMTDAFESEVSSEIDDLLAGLELAVTAPAHSTPKRQQARQRFMQRSRFVIPARR